MGTFRGSDEALEKEIATLERIGLVRLRRAAAALAEVDRDLAELRKERTRRKASLRSAALEETGIAAGSSA